MSIMLEIGILLLIFVAILFLIIVGIYLVKLIIDLNTLANNLNDATYMVKKEIEPILAELNVTLTKLNDMAKTADTQIHSIKKIVATLVGIFGIFFGGMSKVSGGFFKGLMSGFKTFSKK